MHLTGTEADILLPQALINGIAAGALFALSGLGFGFIFRVIRCFHLGHGAVIAISAYVYFVASKVLSLGAVGASVSAIIIGGILGWILEAFVYRPMRRSGATSLALLLISLGLLIVSQNVLSLIFGDAARSLVDGPVVEGMNFWGTRVTRTQIVGIILSLVLTVGMWALLKFSLWGKAYRAIADDPELSLVHGLNRDRVILITVIVGSAIGALTGIIVGYDIHIYPSMGFKLVLGGIVAFIIGGMSSVVGVLLGGMLLGLVQHVGILLFPSQWQETIVFLLLIAFLLFRPEGFFGGSLTKVIR